MSKWISIGEAAKYLGISRDTLRRWEKAGRLKATRSPTNRRYYTKELLDEAIGEKPKNKTSLAPKKTAPKNNLKVMGFGLMGFALAVIIAVAVLFFLK